MTTLEVYRVPQERAEKAAVIHVQLTSRLDCCNALQKHGFENSLEASVGSRCSCWLSSWVGPWKNYRALNWFLCPILAEELILTLMLPELRGILETAFIIYNTTGAFLAASLHSPMESGGVVDVCQGLF